MDSAIASDVTDPDRLDGDEMGIKLGVIVTGSRFVEGLIAYPIVGSQFELFSTTPDIADKNFGLMRYRIGEDPAFHAFPEAPVRPLSLPCLPLHAELPENFFESAKLQVSIGHVFSRKTGFAGLKLFHLVRRGLSLPLVGRMFNLVDLNVARCGVLPRHVHFKELRIGGHEDVCTITVLQTVGQLKRDCFLQTGKRLLLRAAVSHHVHLKAMRDPSR